MTAKYNPQVTPWEIRESDFSSRALFDEKVKFLLRYAVLASSDTIPYLGSLNFSPMVCSFTPITLKWRFKL